MICNESKEHLILAHSYDNDETFQSFCWKNVSVCLKQKEQEGLWQRTKYKNIQIVNNGKYDHSIKKVFSKLCNV